MLSDIGRWLVDAPGVTAHGFCLLWDQTLIWTFAFSDLGIAMAYFSIPVTLAVVARRRRDLVFRPLLWLFAAFILLCGTTHWLDILTLWVPVYRLEGIVKALTAMISIITAIGLWTLLPDILALPSPAQMRAANAALLASQEQLSQAQKMEAVGQLTGGIAHDFNNMLQGITSALTLMERRIAQGRFEETGRYVAAIRQASETAASLTNRLLTFSRRQTLQPRAVDPDDLVRGMEDLIHRTLGPEINFEMSFCDGRWDAVCDPNQLESTLLNLAINARDAMPHGGTLTMSTFDRTLSGSDVADQEAEPGQYVEIEVRDTGTGMPPEVLARVFEPFFTTKPAGAGTGLGLSQVYGFVSQSGGLVRLESTPGKGTAVHLYLPGHEKAARTEPDRQTSQVADPPPGERRAPGTILLVEDQDDVRGQIREALREHGWTVVEARDGREGLRLLQTGAPFDIMVSDIGLPGLNGRQLADAARALDPDFPVLLMTGYAGKALDSPVLDGIEILSKPFSLDNLMGKVDRLWLQAKEVRDAQKLPASGGA